MADAQREDQPLERDGPARVDGANRFSADFSPQPSRFFSCCMPLPKALFQREDVGGFADPAVAIELLDLFGAQPLDVEGAAADEMLQLLDRLRRDRSARRCSGAPRRPLRGSRPSRTRGRSSERQRRASSWAPTGRHRRSWGSRRPRDRPAPSRRRGCPCHRGWRCPWNRGRRCNPRCEASRSRPRRRPPSPASAAPRAERAGAARPGFRSFPAASRPVLPETCGRWPSAGWSSDSPAGLQGQIVDLVDHAVDIIAERRPRSFDPRVVRQHVLGPSQVAVSGLVAKPSAPSRAMAFRLGVGQRRRQLAPPIGEEPQRPAAVMVGSSWRSEPAAALRGLAKVLSPAAACRAFRPRNRHGSCRPRRAPPVSRARHQAARGISSTVRAFAVTFSPSLPSPRVAACTSRPPS